jgi:hypothetical protein
MSIWRGQSVELVPILSRGKHRKPAQGACFMEFVSYLAGERWSDHPACTHPLLAALARQVNDQVSDTHRQLLVGIVPEVIGLSGTDLHIDAAIALRSATAALPVVADERQVVMAAAIVNTERLLAQLDGRSDSGPGPLGRDALARVPQAAAWLKGCDPPPRVHRRLFARQTAPAIVRCAVDGIAHPGVPDHDRLLAQLLVDAIADCRRWCTPAPNAPVSLPLGERLPDLARSAQ